MKSLTRYLLILLLVLPFLAHATDVDVPKNIQAKIDSLYPKATNVEWLKDGSHYQADFVYNDKCVSLVFKKDGSVVYFRQEIDAKDMPKTVSDAINKDYLSKGYKLTYIMTRWDKNDYEHEKIYEAEVTKGRRLHFVRYNAKGEIVTIFEMGKVDITKTPIVP